MDPMTMMALMGAGGAIGQGVGQAGGGLLGMLLADDGNAERARILREWEALQTPSFDTSPIQAPQFGQVAQITPEQWSASYASGAVLPEDRDRARTLEALDYLSKIRDEGYTDAESIRARQLSQEALGANQRMVDSGLSELQRRGALGSGDELRYRLAANQNASELARGGADALALGAVANRQQAGLAGLQGSMALRGQDIGLSRARADAQTRYNEYVSNWMNQAAQANAGARERSQGYNVGVEQQAADRNAASRYDAQRANQATRNQGAQQGFQNRTTRLQGVSGALGGIANQRDAQGQALRDNLAGYGGAAGRVAGGAADYSALANMGAQTQPQQFDYTYGSPWGLYGPPGG